MPEETTTLEPQTETTPAPEPVQPEPQAPEPTEPQPEAAPETPAAPQIDTELRQRAGSYGFDADEFTDGASLDAAVRAFEKRLIGMVRPPTQAPQAQTAPSQPTAEPAEFKIALDPKDYGDEVVNTLKGLHEHTTQRMQVLEQQLQQSMQYQQYLQRRDHMARIREFDSTLAASERKALYGEGPSSRMDPKSPHWQARDEVFRHAEFLERAMATQGMEPPEWGELVRRAERLVHGEQMEKEARVKARQELEAKMANTNRRQGLMPASTRHVETPVDPEAAGIARIQKILDGHS